MSCTVAYHRAPLQDLTLTLDAPSCTIVNMPRVNGNQWRHRRAQLDITSDQAAKILGIAGGALRSIELGIKPASLRLAYRAAGLFQCDVTELLSTDDVPDNPPSKEQDQETNTGPGRDGGSGTNPGKAGKTGPKRLKGVAA